MTNPQQATCATCPWCGFYTGDSSDDTYGYCRKLPPGYAGRFVMVVLKDDWCACHPEMQTCVPDRRDQ